MRLVVLGVIAPSGGKSRYFFCAGDQAKGRRCTDNASGRVAVIQRAKELVEIARQQGYRTDELVEIIEALG